MYANQFDRILKELNQMNRQPTSKRFTLAFIERFLQDDFEPSSASTTLEEDDPIDSTNPMAWLDEMVEEIEIKSNDDGGALNSMAETSFDLVDPMVWLDNLFQESINHHEQDIDMLDMHSDHGSIIVTPKEEAMDSMEEPMVVWLNDMFQGESVGSPIEIKYHPLQSNYGLDSLLGLS